MIVQRFTDGHDIRSALEFIPPLSGGMPRDFGLIIAAVVAYWEDNPMEQNLEERKSATAT